MQATDVTAPDGLNLAVQQWGNPRGLEILLIHGFNQSHLSWQRQVDDPALAADFRMVTLDLRGHGSSDKPLEKDRYAHARWGDDIAAVIRATGLRRPVLVGWSFGGNVICDYVRSFGTENIAGINFVAAAAKTDPAFFGPGRENFAAMLSEEYRRCPRWHSLSGIGDARRCGSDPARDARQIHRGYCPGCEALALRRRRPRAVLGRHSSLQSGIGGVRA